MKGGYDGRMMVIKTMFVLVKTPALEVDGAEKQEHSSVVWFLAPELQAVLLCMLIVTSLVLAVCQLC